jgi:hypothetical protein
LRHCSRWFKQIASIPSALCANGPLNAGKTSKRGRKTGRKPCWGKIGRNKIGWGKIAVLSDLELRANTHMGMTFSHLLPGIAKFAAAAVTPWQSVDSALIRNAVILLLSFVILGIAVAIIARMVDPRIYGSADVEQLLGFAPIVQLPEFSEVANEVNEELLLRLASGIDRAFKDRNLGHCVFTGAGPGVGVTTVAIKVREMLETLGKAAVIAGAAQTSPSTLGGNHEPARIADHLRIPPQFISDANGVRREIIIADAAPLIDSVEAEHLVRSADCTILVIESGVTTRAQLRAVANTLQRIKAPAVGFVLNRVRLAKADPAFRRSLKAMKRRVKSQGQSTDWQMLQTLQLAIDEGSASLDFDVAGPIAESGQPAVNQPAPSPAEAPQVEKIAKADTQQAIHLSEPALSAALPELELPPHAVQESAQEMQQETPLPWDETASNLMAAFADPETGHESRPQTRSISEAAEDTAQKSTLNSARNSEPYHAQHPAPAPEEKAPLALPRLSELRGMCFSQALRELDRAKRPAQPTPGSTTGPNPEIDVLLRAIAPFESLIMQMESVTPQTENIGAANENATKKYPPQSAFVSVKPVAPAKPRGQRDEDNGRSIPGRKPPGGVPDYLHLDHSQIDQSHVDQMHILPSRRGQYKKKT